VPSRQARNDNLYPRSSIERGEAFTPPRLPVDLLRYEANSFSDANFWMLEDDNTYWNELRRGYHDGLASLVSSLPLPPAWKH
jgi:predicted proteasome-type protease